MHYVSWDRTDRDAPKLLAEAGPEVLGVFQEDRASVNGEIWNLTAAHEAGGAVATRGGEEIVRATGSLQRDREIPVTIEGRTYLLVGETSQNWIVDDAAGDKVAQFTSDNSGVRKAVLEFEGDTALPLTDVAGLAWVSRLVLESRKRVSSTVLISTLVLFSAVALMVWFLS